MNGNTKNTIEQATYDLLWDVQLRTHGDMRDYDHMIGQPSLANLKEAIAVYEREFVDDPENEAKTDKPMDWIAFREQVRAIMRGEGDPDAAAAHDLIREVTEWHDTRQPGNEAANEERMEWAVKTQNAQKIADHIATYPNDAYTRAYVGWIATPPTRPYSE